MSTTITTFWLTHVSLSTSSFRCSRNGSFSRIPLPYKILRSCHSWGLSSSDMDCTSLTPIQRLLCILIQLVSTALFVNSVTVRMTVVLWTVMLCSLVDGYQLLGGTYWLWDFPSLTCDCHKQSSNSLGWCSKGLLSLCTVRMWDGLKLKFRHWVEVGDQHHALVVLRQEKGAQYPLDKMLGALQGQSGYNNEEKFLCFCKESNLFLQPITGLYTQWCSVSHPLNYSGLCRHNLLEVQKNSVLPKWFTYSFYMNLTVCQSVCLSVCSVWCMDWIYKHSYHLEELESSHAWYAGRYTLVTHWHRELASDVLCIQVRPQCG